MAWRLFELLLNAGGEELTVSCGGITVLICVGMHCNPAAMLNDLEASSVQVSKESSHW